MKTLVIDTATAACSVALIEGNHVLASRHEIVGRGHAERLVPMIAELPEGGHASRILVDVGPGSFTGVRVGIAAARGLAFGWGARATGYSSLTLLAAAAFARRSLAQLAIVLEGGHGEVFVQTFGPGPVPLAPFASMRPDVALRAIGMRAAIGNGVHLLTDIDPEIDAEDMLPDAADAILLPSADLPTTPIYGRAPDAKLPGGIVP